jgi:hypothetical protein
VRQRELGESYDDFPFWLPQEDAIHSFQSNTFTPDFDSTLSLKSSLSDDSTSTADTLYLSNFSLPVDPLFPYLEIPCDIAFLQDLLVSQSSVYINTAPPPDTARIATPVITTWFSPLVLHETTGRNKGFLHRQSPYDINFENLQAVSQFDNISRFHVPVSNLPDSIPSFDERQSKKSRLHVQPAAPVIEIPSTTRSEMDLEPDTFSRMSPASMVELNLTASIKSSTAPSNTNSPSSQKSTSSTPKR